MAPRPLLHMVLALALAFLLAGCTTTDRSPPPDGNNGNGDAPPDDGPFLGLVPGVDQVPLPAGARGLVQGIVYDVTTGEAIGDATVVATCARHGFPSLVADDPPTKSMPVGSDGSFSMWAPLTFLDCAKVTYNVEAAGYEMVLPLESGPLAPPEQHIVHAGMRPIADP